MEDRELLRRYAETGDQEAFGQLVERYLGMVHGTALRRLGSRELAEEVSQNVFTLMARKATRLKPEVVIAGWLHRTTVLQSSHTMRTERTRAHKMKAFSETLVVDSVEGRHEWNDVVGLLDASMSLLPAKDRDVLFLRFFEGATYRDIGDRLGKSESATQRHATRALEKLSQLLRKKGVTISATALAAELSSELTQAAPTALAASTISQTALSSTTVAASSGTLTQILILMTHTKTSTLVLVGCGLIALCTGGGILVGKLQQPSAQPRVVETTNAPRPDSAAVTTPSPAVVAPDSLLETAPSGVIALLKEAIDVIEKSSSLNSVEDEVRTIVARLDSSDISEALGYSNKVALSEDEKELLLDEIYRRWGALDGPEALEQALMVADPEERKSYVSKVINGWSEVDPEAAYAWYQTASESTESLLGESAMQKLIGGIAKGWIRHDLDAGFAMVEALSYDEQSRALREFGDFANVPGIHQAVASKIQELSDTEIRAEMVRQFGREWAKVAPREAVAWFESLNWQNQSSAMKAGMAIGEGYFERYPREAIDWFFEKVPKEVQPDFIKNLVGRDWAERDLEAATAWLEEKGMNPNDYIQQ